VDEETGRSTRDLNPERTAPRRRINRGAARALIHDQIALNRPQRKKGRKEGGPCQEPAATIMPARPDASDSPL
jgi:hypothetical protein